MPTASCFAVSLKIDGSESPQMEVLRLVKPPSPGVIPAHQWSEGGISHDSHPFTSNGFSEGFLEEPLVTQKIAPLISKASWTFGLIVPLRMKRNRGDIVDQHWHDTTSCMTHKLCVGLKSLKETIIIIVLRALNDSTKNLQNILIYIQ